jgi:hypothetical protein
LEQPYRTDSNIDKKPIVAKAHPLPIIYEEYSVDDLYVAHEVPLAENLLNAALEIDLEVDDEYLIVDKSLNAEFEGDVIYEDDYIDDFGDTNSDDVFDQTDLTFDYLVGLEDYDDFYQHYGEDESLHQDYIDRPSRAMQIAIEVASEFDWDKEHIPLLQNIFIENGWSSAKSSIIREIGAGMTPDELYLAKSLRNLWVASEHYWISFSRIKSNSAGQQADNLSINISWPNALRLIRAYSEMPDFEEIYQSIEEAYDLWYNSDALRRGFPVFLAYLNFSKSQSSSQERDIFTFANTLDFNSTDYSGEQGSYWDPTVRKLYDLGIEVKYIEKYQVAFRKLRGLEF